MYFLTLYLQVRTHSSCSGFHASNSGAEYNGTITLTGSCFTCFGGRIAANGIPIAINTVNVRVTANVKALSSTFGRGTSRGGGVDGIVFRLISDFDGEIIVITGGFEEDADLDEDTSFEEGIVLLMKSHKVRWHFLLFGRLPRCIPCFHHNLNIHVGKRKLWNGYFYDYPEEPLAVYRCDYPKFHA